MGFTPLDYDYCADILDEAGLLAISTVESKHTITRDVMSIDI